MKWNKYRMKTTTEAVDLISYTLGEMGIEGIEIEDKIPLSDEDKKKMFIDILPDLGEDDGVAYVSFYIEPEKDHAETLQEVTEAVKELADFVDIGEASIEKSETADVDWMNNWKKFWKPFKVDDKIIIKPTWEKLPEDTTEDTLVVELDPGTAFGTGMHHTTRLCITQMKKYLQKGQKLFDVGCGSGILSEKTENELTDCLLGFRYWIDEPGNDAMWFWSENHALMFHTCQLLAGELFPDEVFTNSGLTGRQMQAKAKNMLYDWFVTFRKEGFTEWNSSPYLPIDTLGFGSLYAFAQDPAMRELGREGMDFAYYLLAVHSQQGIFASSSGRTYIKEQFGNWSNCPSGLSWIGYGYGVPGHAGKGITSYCLSDYEPPKEFAQWFSIPRGKEMICQTTQGNDGYVDLYTYKTADYMMTSANDFHPGEPGHQENPFQLTFNAVAQLWVTHPGERVLFGAARPSYWAGNGTLPKVNQYKAFAGLIYDIAPEHPVDFTHLYLPSMEFDLCEVEGKWAFVQLGSAYAAVYCSNGMRMQDFGSNKDRECIAEGRRCIWLVRAAQADEFAAFEDFKAAMRGAALDADAEGRRYRFVDPVYGELRCQWGETLYVNDAPMQYSGFDNYGKLTMQEK